MIDPFFGTVVGAVGNVLGAAVATPPAGPAISGGNPAIGLDFSDWTVATSGSKAEGSSDKPALPNWLLMAGLALVAVVAVRWIKSR